MKFTLFTILGFASLALSAPATLETRETAIEATNRLMYSVTISQFIAARNARNPSFVNWESNGCSYSPDNPFGFNFVNSCHRHVIFPSIV
ncbi:hypothetical protein M011DRAFT_464219 [Sporormia fimetaria CBS 119925]|uniref:Uncharacterized protein n=1 Tax=Sporormia fimetaria CBS 119925 TaxID=1340428 RepID=A0A6A6VLK5_9PLEO|nr:hypothetical protein M011DRAFT_464219 [Sporormia fimetaria CBS 119925]